MAIWKMTLDVSPVFHREMPFTEKRDEIVKILRDSAWQRPEVQVLVDRLADVEDIDDFDFIWDLLYDWADADRVWIVTR